jgi:hypothetical protein
MELLDGVDLARMLASNGPLPAVTADNPPAIVQTGATASPVPAPTPTTSKVPRTDAPPVESACSMPFYVDSNGINHRPECLTRPVSRPVP